MTSRLSVSADRHGKRLDILDQACRDTKATKRLLTRLIGQFDLPRAAVSEKLHCDTVLIAPARRKT
tara:strand:- start:2143 stop:2340 length:198 start_codon:yes stop_codon:yes gene_type:complete